jgi:nickel superoxide dismutase
MPRTTSLLARGLRAIDRISEPRTVHAHCDIPCGIYDPHLAQIAALSCLRMDQLIAKLEMTPNNETGNSFTRYVAVKEEHGELVKREIRVIWGDYFKPEHTEKYPELNQLVWDIMKVAGKVRQGINEADANDLLAKVQRFAEIFWETKGVPTKKQSSNQAVGGEIVVPAN